MSLETIFELSAVQGKWAVGIIGVIVFLFLVARRHRRKRPPKTKSTMRREDILIEWSQGPGGQIPIQPWMEAPATNAVLDALASGGKEVRFIGGCVRDAILHRPVADIDLATPEPPERVIELLEAADIKAVPTGIEHGTITAVTKDQSFQITTLRRDVKTDGRHAEVEFTDNWKEDAARRDFTFNTLGATADGMIYDYFNGIQDLAERRIHFVGRAEERIKEDYLRILRYFRFIAVIGMRIDDKYGYEQCLRYAPEIANLSGERVRDELFKILESEIKYDAMNLMIDGGVTEHFLPEAKSTVVLKRLIWLETSAIKFDSVHTDPIRRMAALIETDAAGVEAIAARLKMSNVQKKTLLELVSPSWTADPFITDEELRALLYRLGPACIIDLCLLEWSRRLIDMPRLPREQTDAWLRVIETADQWRKIEFPLRGQDVLDLDIEPGPRVSELLAEVETWWTTGGCQADRDACLERLQGLVG